MRRPGLSVLVIVTCMLSACSASDKAVQPQPGPKPPSATTQPAVKQLTWGSVVYPIDRGCRPGGHTVYQTATHTFSGRTLTIVDVSCRYGGCCAPNVLYAYAGQPGRSSLRRVATLLSPWRGALVFHFAVAGRVVTAHGTAYSSADLPMCCPDLNLTGVWRWTGSQFVSKITYARRTRK